MGVLDKFLNVMKLNDDNEEDYPEGGYLDDDEPDDAPETSASSRIHRILSRRSEEEEADPVEEEMKRTVPFSTSRKGRSQAAAYAAGEEGGEDDDDRGGRGFASRRSSSKISPIRTRKKEDAGMEVCIIKPHSVEDADQITETLLSNCTVILNVEGLEIETAQRIIDFASGSCYALDGNLQRISNYIFLLTPASVEITGDFQAILSGAFDVPFEHR